MLTFYFSLIDNGTYSVIEFFRDIKKELSRIIEKKLTYRQISINFLKMKSKWVINDTILRSKGDPDYFIVPSLLKIYEKALRLKMGQDFLGLKKNFELYRTVNLGNGTKLHPNIKKKNFEKIDSKKKAYWLGWLYAEGHLSRYFLRVEIGLKDGILLKRFVKDLGLNSSKVRFHRRYNLKSHKYTMSLSVKIYNRKFREYLTNLGFPIGNKSAIIRFPDFSNPKFASVMIRKELEMAFVLGFFDGDGSHGFSEEESNSPVIYSKSKKFLHDIVQLFRLPYYLKPKPRNDKTYYLGIGAKFFMLLTDNYFESLPRKRVAYFRFYGKFLLTKAELQKIVDDKPLITSGEIADLHLNLTGVNISERTVSDKLKDWNIKRMSKDLYYWQKTIDLRLKGWSLKAIYEKEFKFKNWGTYSKVFFKRVFRNDDLISNKEGNIHKRIEDSYKPKG